MTGVVPLAEVPRADQADGRVAARDEAVGGLDDHLGRVGVVLDELLVAEAAEDHEAQVVRPLIILYSLQPFGILARGGMERLVARQPVAEPQRAGEEAAGPVLGVDALEFGHQRTREAREGVEFGCGLFELETRAVDAAFHGGDFRITVCGAGGQGEKGQQAESRKQIFSHSVSVLVQVRHFIAIQRYRIAAAERPRIT